MQSEIIINEAICFDFVVLSSFFFFFLQETPASNTFRQIRRRELVIFALHVVCLLQDWNFNAGPDTAKLFPQPAEHRHRSFVGEMLFSHIKDPLTLTNPSNAVVMR